MTGEGRPGAASASGTEPVQRGVRTAAHDPGDLPTMTMRLGPSLDAVTIGVVIDIPEPWGTELQEWRASFGDTRATSIPTHITLLPPTSVPSGLWDDVVEHLEKVCRRTRPFALRLRGTDTFRPVSPVVFVQVVEGAPACDTLQQQVRTGPLVRDLAFPFHPHVTVAHDVDDASLDRALATLNQFDAVFPVTAIGLYEHGADGVWRRQMRFAFGGLG